MRFLADTNDWGLITPLSSFLLAFPKMVYKYRGIAREKPYSQETRRTAKVQEQDIVKHKLSGIVCHFYPNNADAIIERSGSIVDSVPHFPTFCRPNPPLSHGFSSPKAFAARLPKANSSNAAENPSVFSFWSRGFALITLRKRKITVRRSSRFCSPAARWVTLQPAWAHAAMYSRGRLKKASCASCRPRCSPPH